MRALLAVAHPHGEGLEGYGVYNVHERIQLSFGTRYGLSFESALGKGTTVEVLHPLVVNEGVAAPVDGRLPPEELPAQSGSRLPPEV